MNSIEIFQTAMFLLIYYSLLVDFRRGMRAGHTCIINFLINATFFCWRSDSPRVAEVLAFAQNKWKKDSSWSYKKRIGIRILLLYTGNKFAILGSTATFLKCGLLLLFTLVWQKLRLCLFINTDHAVSLDCKQRPNYKHPVAPLINLAVLSRYQDRQCLFAT